MRRMLTRLALAVLVVACADKSTAPRQSGGSTADQSSAAGSVGSHSSSPATLFFCANPSASVFVRAQCKSNEDQLDPVALGLVGPQGPPGTPGISAYEIVSNKQSVAIGATASVHAQCPTGKTVLGGGFSVESAKDVLVMSSDPTDGAGTVNNTEWTATVQNTSTTAARNVTVTATCAIVTQ